MHKQLLLISSSLLLAASLCRAGDEGATAAAEHIQRGDRIHISLRGVFGPSGAEIWEVVGREGQIKLPLISYIRVEGLTPRELAKKIREAFVPKHVDAVTVEVAGWERAYAWYGPLLFKPKTLDDLLRENSFSPIQIHSPGDYWLPGEFRSVQN